MITDTKEDKIKQELSKLNLRYENIKSKMLENQFKKVQTVCQSQVNNSLISGLSAKMAVNHSMIERHRPEPAIVKQPGEYSFTFNNNLPAEPDENLAQKLK